MIALNRNDFGQLSEILFTFLKNPKINVSFCQGVSNYRLNI